MLKRFVYLSNDYILLILYYIILIIINNNNKIIIPANIYYKICVIVYVTQIHKKIDIDFFIKLR